MRSSTENGSTTTKLLESITSRVTKPAMPGSGRSGGSKNSSSRCRRRSGGRKPKCVERTGAVTSEEWAPGSRILHSKTRRVKFDRTRVIRSKATNRKEVVDQRRSNKNIRKAKGARSAGGTHGRDGKTRAIRHHDGRRKGGRRGADRGKYTGVRSSVVGSAGVRDPLRTHGRSQGRSLERRGLTAAREADGTE